MPAVVFLFLIGLAAMAAQITPVGADSTRRELIIQIGNLRNTNGKIHVALFNQKHKGFPNKTREIISRDLPVKGQTAKTVFRLRGEGPYAIAIYHDENSNGRLDRNLIGIPLEGYGFSNNPVSRTGPPDYDQTTFRIKGKRMQMEIKMVYLF